MNRKTSLQWLASKWHKTQLLCKNPLFNSYIPTTKKFNSKTLYSLLNTYGMVYVKPNRGSFGQGVMRIEKTGTGFRYQHRERLNVFNTYDAMYHSIAKEIGKREYLIQKGISLLKYKGRRFDIRVMVQRNPFGEWETTGIIGRLGHPKKIVTNYHSGGTPMSVDILLKPHLNPTQIKQFKTRLNKLGLQVAEQFQRKYSGIKEIGIDIGIDRSVFPQILEVNTRPDPYIFNQLPNKSMYRKVIRYARAYGRIK
ncbi:YheC/YheD family protein [Paenibacillus abyssi]|uniref:Endospore coat-associated protein n=1 Tax=Paenibacillus abyssi TaxID=1340531 RepID=A0A917D8P8_9BACL|nr:YheC/YheD family protein [Paenibacillus abyssi]GGG13265.1 hypothetical protein GCM10010916_32750 [Paenibacillus abyssi]